ncbi:RHS repeat-associated core domain-containing protein [Porticoccus sp. W117]|uniref:RHS repeat-associated core domain-containing protein n=1 Tax=Porticoccus sp. W117 TaxID=3054777 RepID=UPI0025974D28|nr:RHS repeat-associated core domain-containing protein [Porticoccus sp. W117]MDM3871864.1 RHS repeat-associated core domain-containing protein [Porticoccus sp. W117]
MNSSKLAHFIGGAIARGIKTATAIAIALFTGLLQAGTTPYHQTSLSGPATDNDGSYTVTMSVESTHPWSVNDTVLVAALSTRLNGSGSWAEVQSFSNLPISIATSGIPVNRTGQGSGTHNYQANYVIYGPSTGYQAITDYRDVAVTLPGSGGGSSSNGITTSPNEVTNTEVGTLPMGMDVASNGDAVASVPLQLIPGVAGFAPSLALTYQSGRAIDRVERSLPEDTIGYGWRLSGLSEIRRCVVGQNNSANIALNNNDSLCLDGIPLVRTSGSHFAVGAQYRTQVESYQKIEIKGSGSNLWFEVTTPDGTVLEYGNGNGSRVDYNGGTDYQWSLNKATSVDGNEITYSYYHDAAKGINYPTNIHYTDADIDFEYRARTDAAAVSIGSASQTQSVFLHTVRVSMDSKTVREYRLLDEVVSSKRRLNKIQLCGYDQNGSNPECLKATDINWINSSVSQVGVLMSQAINGLGADNRFEYGTLAGSSGSFLFGERPFGNHSLPSGTQYRTIARNVATKVRRDNGLGGFHDTTYAYQSHGVQSTNHWGFLGFFAQRIKDLQSGITTYVQYRMDYPFFGSVARVNQYNNTYGSHTETFTRTETDYTSRSQSYIGGSTRYPYSDRNASYIYESNSQIGVSENESAFTFNSSGLITQVVSTAQTGTGSSTSGGTSVWGDVPNHSVSGAQGTQRTTVKFTNRTSGGNWLIGFVNQTKLESWKGSFSGTAITQTTNFSPDADSLRVASFTRFPGHATLNLTTTYTYDSMGRTTDTAVSGANVASRDTQAGQINGFDADRYPLNFTNDKNHTTTIGGCDLRFGRYTQATDTNGESGSATFDHFGRQVTSTNSDGITVTTTYIADGSVTINGATSAYRVQSNSSVTPLNYIWYDKLGRAIRSEIQSFNGTSYSRTDTWYDTQGRVLKQSLPYFSGQTAYYVTPTYDIRGRITKITRPDNSYTDTSYTVSGNNVIVEVTDRVNNAGGGFEEYQTKRSVYNLLGQLTSTTDAYGTSAAATVTYVYDANGNPTSVTAPGGAVTTMQYDAAGNRTQLTGPNVGTVITTYTALGQIRTNTDAENQTTTYTYDTLGRQTSRVSPDGTSTWVWDTATNGKGLLASRSNSGFTETYNYNSDSKLSSTVTNITAIGASSGTNFTTSYTYDSSGRPLTTSYPGGYSVTRTYNSHGYLSQLKNGSAVLQTFSGTDAFGNSTSESYGNGVATTRTYDPKTGRLTAIDTTKSSTTFQNLDYAWRSNGTLQSRIANPNTGVSTTRNESFTYDVHNRLTQARTLVNGSYNRDLNYQYNQLGNILSKTSTKAGDVDVTGYSYHSTKKHAVTTATVSGVGAQALTYDDNGAIIKYDRSGTVNDRHIQYNAANQPTKIVVGASLTTTNPTATDEFAYGPDGQLYARKTTWKEGGITREEHVSYIGAVEIINYVNNPTLMVKYKTQVGNSVMHVKTMSLNPVYGFPPPGALAYPYNQVFLYTESLEYAHRDHLGSIETVTDQYGSRLHQVAFEPFGSRKDSDWTKNIDSSELNSLLTDSVTFYINLFPYLSNGDPIPASVDHKVARGFTGHEHLDKTGFIHMNGRVYDPELGRFVSPDPIVQAPTYSQSWNRYTYTFNSPLSFTDPSGYSSDIPGGEIHYENDIHYGEYQRADDRLIRRLFPRVWGPRECPHGFVLVKENRFKTGCKPHGVGGWEGNSDYGLGYGVIDPAFLEKLRSSGPGSISQTGVGIGSSADVRSEALAAATLAQEGASEGELESGAIEQVIVIDFFIPVFKLFRFGKVAKGLGKFDDAATSAAGRLGFDPADVVVKNGIADIPILFTSKVSLKDLTTVTNALKSQGVNSIRVNTGPIINPSIVSRLEKAADTGKSVFGGFRATRTNNPENLFILEKAL